MAVDNKKPASRLRSRKLLAGIAVVVCAAIAVLFFFFLKNPTSKSVPTQHYSGFSTYTVKGTAAQAGMSFIKPSQLVLFDSSRPNIAPFEYNVPGHGIVSFMVATSPSGAGLTKGVIDDFNYELYSHTGNNYSVLSTAYKKIVSNWFSKPKQVSLNTPTSFRPPNYDPSANMWLYDIQVLSQSNAKYQGSLLLAASQKGYYYLLIFAPTPEWKANQATWNKILASVKIDQ